MVTITPINVGTIPNDDTGDSLRNAFIKVNTNEANLNTGITTNAAITGGSIDGTIIGATTAATGAFTGTTLTGDMKFALSSIGINAAAGNVGTNWDFDFREITTAIGTIRMFRDTNSTGMWRQFYFAGDGSTNVQHQIAADNFDTFFCNLGGDFFIGQSSGNEKLDVLGNILASGTIKASTVLETGSFTVATLPSASATPNGIIKVSDETGGETVAFSDGTNWRRVQDRAIVA